MTAILERMKTKLSPCDLFRVSRKSGGQEKEIRMREEENSNIDEHVIREIKKSAPGRLALEHNFFHCYARTHTTRIPASVRSEYSVYIAVRPTLRFIPAKRWIIILCKKITVRKLTSRPSLLLLLIPLYARHCVTACIKDKGSVSKGELLLHKFGSFLGICGGWNLLWCHTELESEISKQQQQKSFSLIAWFRTNRLSKRKEEKTN